MDEHPDDFGGTPILGHLQMVISPLADMDVYGYLLHIYIYMKTYDYICVHLVIEINF